MDDIRFAFRFGSAEAKWWTLHVLELVTSTGNMLHFQTVPKAILSAGYISKVYFSCAVMFTNLLRRTTNGWLRFGWTSTRNTCTCAGPSIGTWSTAMCQPRRKSGKDSSANLSVGLCKILLSIYRRSILRSSLPISLTER